MTANQRVWLLDSCAIINVKTTVPANQQWSLLRRLEEMVLQGELTFPRQVLAEVTQVTHPDAPGVWAEGVFSHIRFPIEPDFERVRQVMASPAGRVVDPNKEHDDGDPYVLAMALQLNDAGYYACVVTDDHREHPDHIPMVMACDHLGLSWCRLAQFLDDVRTAETPEKPTPAQQPSSGADPPHQQVPLF